MPDQGPVHADVPFEAQDLLDLIATRQLMVREVEDRDLATAKSIPRQGPGNPRVNGHRTAGRNACGTVGRAIRDEANSTSCSARISRPSATRST